MTNVGQPRGNDAFSICAALDDAVAQLQVAAGVACPISPDGSPTRQQFAVNPSIANQAPSDAKATLDVIEAMCQADDRKQALERLVRAICPPGTAGTVRAGMGGNRMKLLFDSRLGWIGAGSSLFDQVANSWNAKAAKDPDGKAIELETISLATARGGYRCQIWVHDDPAAVRWLGPVSDTIASVLWSRPARRLPLSSMGQSGTLGSGAGKLLVAGIIVGILMVAAWPVPYRINCQAGVETTSGRFISSPFGARLLEVKVRPGQQVSAGQTLLVLDGRPLRIQRESLQAELHQAVKEHNVALASRRIAEAQQSALMQKKLQRKIQLIDDRLKRLNVTSPIDGVIVSGDLQRHVGAPLELGQSLLEIASMDRMTVELEIPEHEIGFVSLGMDTRIKIDAIGGRSMDLPLQEIYPAAELRDDQNVFVGRIEVDNVDGSLRPGMRGKATAYGPMRPWVWSWIRGAFERCLWWIGF